MNILKSLIFLVGIILLVNSLYSIRTMLWSKKELDDYLIEGSKKIENMKFATNSKAPYIVNMVYTLLVIMFLSYSISFLYPSKLIVIPVLLILETIYTFYEGFEYLQDISKLTLKSTKLNIIVSIISSAYNIFFLSLYVMSK